MARSCRRALAKRAYPDAGNQIQDRLAKERFIEGISDPQVLAKLRDLPWTRPACCVTTRKQRHRRRELP